MTLSGEGEYNLNILKEIKATESLYELKQEDRNCQGYGKEVTYDTCTTKYFMEQLRLKCGCLPFAIINTTIYNEKVCGKCKTSFDLWVSCCYNLYARFPCVIQKKRRYALKQSKKVHQQNAWGTVCRYGMLSDW